MLFWSYMLLPLKQLFRIRMAFFFTLIFPVILFLLYGHAPSVSRIAFLNFAMQSAMLQTVGIFVSVQKSTSWGEFVSTLPAPSIYRITGTIGSMFLIGLCGVCLILLIDYYFYQTLSFLEMMLILFSTSIGAIPMGTLGYLIGCQLEPMSARSFLTMLNLVFLSMTFLPEAVKKLLELICLPNVWLNFSSQLVLHKYLDLGSLISLLFHFLCFVLLIHLLE